METPQEYSDFILQHGGRTRFGEPRFMLYWGERENKKLAVPDDFFAPYLHCWVLAEWRPPEDFGIPSEWPKEMGNFPSRGGYVPLHLFRDEDQKPHLLESRWLNKEILAMYLYIVLRHEHDSLAQRASGMKEMAEVEELATLKRLADYLENRCPVFKDAASYRGQTNCNTVVRQKMDEIERQMRRARNFARRVPRSTSQLTSQDAARLLATPRYQHVLGQL
jgi:hypothetical protein